MNEQITCKVIGQMDNTIDHTFESANRVYDSEGIAPALNTCGGGGLQPKVIVDDMYPNRIRPYGEYAPCIRSGREGLKVVEPISTNGTNISGCIRATYYKNGERNIIENIKRKMGYEGVIELQSCAMRGRYEEDGTTNQKMELGSENYANAITTVSKDSMVMEKEMVGIKQATTKGYIECEVGGVADLSYPDSEFRRGRVQGNGQISPTLTASNSGIARIEKVGNMEAKIEKVGQISNDGSQYGTVVGEKGISATLSAGTHGYANSCIQTKYRIRKLTPRETWRLQDFSDEDFNRAASVNSNTALYKQSGNSITCNVLVALFGQMFGGKENVYKQIDDKFNEEETDDVSQEETKNIPTIKKEKTKMHDNMKYFKEIYNTLENDDMKKFFKAIVKAAPEYFWSVPASSTGKYHPSYALGDGGLVRHTCAVVRFLNHTFDIECMNHWTSRERDLLRLSGMAHDMLKSGTQEEYEVNKYTKHEHPLLAANMIMGLGTKYLPKEEVDIMVATIASHMGQWNTSQHSSIELPKPVTKYQIALHWADYMASRKDIEVVFEEI